MLALITAWCISGAVIDALIRQNNRHMASAGCAGRFPHHHVRMDYRLSLIERDITAHPNDFVLNDDGNFPDTLCARDRTNPNVAPFSAPIAVK
jgi:hypothetical protein